MTPAAPPQGTLTFAAEQKAHRIGSYCLSLCTAVCFPVSFAAHGEHGAVGRFRNLPGSASQAVVETRFKPVGFGLPDVAQVDSEGLGAVPVEGQLVFSISLSQLDACSPCCPAQELSVVPPGL